MTLDELLALLPDNSSGEISAADMRTIVTELYDNTATLAGDATIVAQAAMDRAVAVDARIDALEDAGNTRSAAGVYRLDTNAANMPGSGEVVSDTGALETATMLRFHQMTRGGIDLSSALNAATKIACQDENDSTRWATYDVTGPATEGAAWFIPVIVTGTGPAAIAGGQNDIVFTFTWTAT